MPIRGSVDPAYRWLSRSQQTTGHGSLLLVDIDVKPSPGKQLLKQPP
jgi:hypothetical protein